MSSLREQVAIVTGASSGIGEATARALGESGAATVVAARRVDRLDTLAREIEAAGGRALPVKCDVSDRDACRRLVEAGLDAFG